MISQQGSARRVEKIREALRKHDVDALLIKNFEEEEGARNIRYLSGFTGSSSVCIVTPTSKILVTDTRYELQAPQEAEGWDIRIIYPGEKLKDVLRQRIRSAAVSSIGLMKGDVSWEFLSDLRNITRRYAKVVPLPSIVKEVRAVKDLKEVEAIQSAVRMMEEVLRELYDMVEPGVTSDYQLAGALKHKLIDRGSDVSFAPIILSGSDSAFIHGDPFKLRRERERRGIVPAEKVIQRGDILQFDVGCMVNGYASDISRVLVVGPATEKQRRMHAAIVAAIEASKELYVQGRAGNEAQECADRVLKEHGFEKGMRHGLGHGIGLAVHELPLTRSTSTFEAGNVVSLEPGIYEEDGGERIERVVLITENGPVFLDDELTTDLLELGYRHY